MSAGLKVKCPLCKRVSFETSKHYDPNVTPNGSFVKSLLPYLHDWLCTSATKVSGMTCPECLAQLAPTGRLTVETVTLEKFFSLSDEEKKKSILPFGIGLIIKPDGWFALYYTDDTKAEMLRLGIVWPPPVIEEKKTLVETEEAFERKLADIDKPNEISSSDEARIAALLETLPHTCPICEKSFKTALALNGHSRSHLKK